jgi:hypothetical protein
MVQLHCIAAGVTPPRPTVDVDTLIHVELPGNSLSVLHEGPCPDVVGALMLKADAYRIDSRDRLRHLQDSVSLAVLLSESTKRPKMFGSGPRRIRQLLKALSAYRPEQLGVTEDDWQDAQIALQELLEWR